MILMADRSDVKLTPAAEKILSAASRLFYAYGLHAIGVERIAAEAGVTKKTIYDRFGSKEELELAYLRRREDQWRAALRAHLDSHAEPGISRVLAVFDAADAWYTGRSTKGCSAVNARAEMGPDPLDQRISCEVTEQKVWMLERFRSLCEEAGLDRSEELSRQLLLLLEGALVTLGTRSFSEPMTVARACAETLLRSSA